MVPNSIDHGGQPNMMNDNIGRDNNIPQYSAQPLRPTDSRDIDHKEFEAPAYPIQYQRGRIHDKVDVLNGVSGLEHLSNQLITERHSPSLNKI